MLEDVLTYDPLSGQLTWKEDTKNYKHKRGDIAGSLDKKGYVVVRYNRKVYKAHRLAWYLYYGEWPSKNIDHVNRDRQDNSIKNLRLDNHRYNSHNTKVFNGGVRQRGNKWLARIYVKGKDIHLGTFSTKSEASLRYFQEAEKLR